MKVAMFEHRSPYDGCFWEYQYIGIDDGDKDDIELHPIYWASDQHGFPHTVKELQEGYYFENVQIEEWTGNYPYHENYVVRFYDFAAEHGLDFVWTCSHCGSTSKRPTHSDDYGGNGGVGIVFYSWLCEDCYSGLSCGYCGTVNDPDSKWWSYDEDLVKGYKNGICPSCGEEY